MVDLPLTAIVSPTAPWLTLGAAGEGKDPWAETDYWWDMRTLCLASFGFCPMPVELHPRWAMRQLEQGDSLSQRIYRIEISVGTVGSHESASCLDPAKVLGTAPGGVTFLVRH